MCWSCAAWWLSSQQRCSSSPLSLFGRDANAPGLITGTVTLMLQLMLKLKLKLTLTKSTAGQSQPLGHCCVANADSPLFCCCCFAAAAPTACFGSSWPSLVNLLTATALCNRCYVCVGVWLLLVQDVTSLPRLSATLLCVCVCICVCISVFKDNLSRSGLIVCLFIYFLLNGRISVGNLINLS